jgi:hypothetical protein
VIKTAVGGGHSSNIEELEQFSAEQWVKLPVERLSKLIDGYKKRFYAVILAKDCATKN